MSKTSKTNKSTGNTTEKKIVVTNIGLHDLNKQLKQVISENTKTDITSNSISIIPGVETPSSGASNSKDGITYNGISQDAGQISTVQSVKGQNISVPDNFLDFSENPLDTVKEEIFDSITTEMSVITSRLISAPDESLQVSNLLRPLTGESTSNDQTSDKGNGVALYKKPIRQPIGQQLPFPLSTNDSIEEPLIKTNYKLNDIKKLAKLDQKIETAVEELNNKVIELGQKHNEMVSDWIDGISEKASDFIGKKAFDSWLDDVGDGKAFETANLEDFNIREYLKIRCPEFMHYAGLNTIDFAAVFLNPSEQMLLGNIQSKVSDAIAIWNNVDEFVSKETLVAVKNLVTFLVEDLTKQVLSYLQKIFNKYLSPSFPIGLAKDYATITKRYMLESVKDPRDILKEITVKNEIKLDDANNERIKMLTTQLNDKLNGSLSEGGKKFKKKLENFDKYYDEIVKYLKYGPEYALEQVEVLYKKYLNMGIREMNRILNNFDKIVYNSVENGGKVSGQYLAKKANDLQEKKLRRAIQKTNEKLAKAQIKANAVINKAVMNLLAQIGG